jgi:hypothetical protein
MSHLVTIESQVKDPVVLAGARQRLKLAAPVQAVRNWLILFMAFMPTFAPAQQSTERANLETRARVFLLAIARDDIGTAVKDYDEAMRKALPAEKLRGAWKNLAAHGGAFKSLGGAQASKADRYDVITVRCDFEKAAYDARVVFDAGKHVAGLSFTKSKGVKDSSFTEGDWVITLVSAVPVGITRNGTSRSEEWFETTFTFRNTSKDSRHSLEDWHERLKQAELVDAKGTSVGRKAAFFFAADGSRVAPPTLFPGTTASAHVNFALPAAVEKRVGRVPGLKGDRVIMRLAEDLTLLLPGPDPKSSIRLIIPRQSQR